MWFIETELEERTHPHSASRVAICLAIKLTLQDSVRTNKNSIWYLAVLTYMRDFDKTGQDVGFPGLKEGEAEIIDMARQDCDFSLQSLGIEVQRGYTRLEIVVRGLQCETRDLVFLCRSVSFHSFVLSMTPFHHFESQWLTLILFSEKLSSDSADGTGPRERDRVRRRRFLGEPLSGEPLPGEHFWGETDMSFDCQRVGCQRGILIAGVV